MKNIKEIEVGLIKGRHKMPVEDYIFDGDINNVNDFKTIEKYMNEWIDNNITIHSYYGAGINQIDYSDVECLTSDETLIVYITGLTQVTASLIKCCMYKGIHLTLMHYDRDTEKYIPQVIY